MKPVKTALIGLGFSGQTFHLPFVDTLPEFTWAGVQSSNTELCQTLLPGVSRFNSLESTLASDAELVIVTSPNEFHFDHARQALMAGKHVLLEKPFANSFQEAQELVSLAAKQNRLLTVYQNRRWDGDFLTVKKLIASGKLGRVAHFESHFDRFRPTPKVRWREAPGPGAGFLFDLGAHLIDQALVLFGEPQTVTATVKTLRDGGLVDDYFHLQLGYGDNPLQVVLHSSALTAEPAPRFQVYGTQGSYIKLGLDPQEDRLKAGVRPDDAIWAMETQEQFGRFNDGEQSSQVTTELGGYQNLYQQLAKAIRGEADNPVPADQAAKVIRIIELAFASEQQGKTLSFDG